MVNRDLYVGLMSGTSLDGADAVLVDFSQPPFKVISHAHVAFDPALRDALLALTVSGPDEIEQAGRLGRVLAQRYADAVKQVLAHAGTDASNVKAIGCHGQTVRHRPGQGFTLQIGNPALLAELTGIAVVADFRSRDVAADGQGAPLVPAFHAVAFERASRPCAVVNIGGIANVTLMPKASPILGFDTGPGNCLMDMWVQRHTGKHFDAAGAWASGAKPLPGLRAKMLEEPFFLKPAPKSSGRELFNDAWLRSCLTGSENAQAVQATLLELTVETISRSIEAALPATSRVIVCGGGAYNDALMRRLSERLTPRPVDTSSKFGLDPDQVESVAFAWLAKRCIEGQPGNLPEVTGAKGLRTLGAIYPR